jgi:hypothetical protein
VPDGYSPHGDHGDFDTRWGQQGADRFVRHGRDLGFDGPDHFIAHNGDIGDSTEDDRHW